MTFIDSIKNAGSRLALLTCMLLPTSLIGQAVDTVHTGIRTVALAYDSSGGHVHALSEGRDLDFNLEIDAAAGELPAEIYKIDPATRQVVDTLWLAGPARTLALAGDGVGYFLQPNPVRISSYATASMTMLQDTLILAGAAGEQAADFFGAALTFSPREDLIYVGTGGFAASGYTVAYSRQGRLIHYQRTGFGAGKAIFQNDAPGLGAWIINQGTFGNGNSSLSYLNVQSQFFGNRNQATLGSLANGGFLAQDGRLFVVLNGSHRVQILNGEDGSSLGQIDTETNGFDGPRQAVLIEENNRLAVSTYENDVRFYDLAGVNATDTVAVGQKPDAMLRFGDKLFVANTGFTGFGEDSTVFVIDLASRQVADTLLTGIRTSGLGLGSDSLLYALSEGRDSNFDSTLNAGSDEMPATLSVFDPATGNLLAQRTLAGFAGHLAIGDIGAAGFYCVQYDPQRISRIALGTLDVLQDTVLLASDIGYGIYDLAVGQTQELLITTGGFSEPGRLLVFEDGEITASYICDFGASDVLQLEGATPGTLSYLVINEGGFGSESASVTKITAGDSVYRAITGDWLGDTANSGAIQNNRIYIVNNGSHTIEVLDLVSMQHAGTVNVGTMGFDGPRDVLIHNNGFGVVSTYSNDVRSFDLNSLSVFRTTVAGSKPEGLLQVDNALYVANGGFTGFAEDNTIFIFDEQTVDVVDDAVASGMLPSALQLSQNYPNPLNLRTAQSTRIDFVVVNAGTVDIRIYNVLGQQIRNFPERNLPSGNYSVFWDGRTAKGELVSSGAYFYRMRVGGRSFTRAMFVQR